jgi:hypothetical protein
VGIDQLLRGNVVNPGVSMTWARANPLMNDSARLKQVRMTVRPRVLDAHRFRGTCYRAANWIYLGQTTGRGRMDREHKADGQAIKDI